MPLFFQNVAGSPELIRAHLRTIGRLLSGERGGLHLEKLRGTHQTIYAVRINQADRLLFLPIRIQEKNCLLFFAEVLSHDYHKSIAFRAPASLNKLISEFSTIDLEKSSFEQTEAIDEENLPTLPEATGLSLEKVYYLGDCSIILDAEQKGVVRLNYPFMVSGGAGSGKTATGLISMNDFPPQRMDGTPSRILYVTFEEHLVKNIQASWEKMEQQRELRPEAVFLTYQNFICQTFRLSPEQCVAPNHAMNWLHQYVYNHKKLVPESIRAQLPQHQPNSASYPKVLKSIFNEWYLLSGLNEHYESLGQGQSYFSSKEEREWVIKTYHAYLEELRQENLIAPCFYQPTETIQATYDLIFLDESQLGSTLACETLRKHAVNFIASHDPKQGEAVSWKTAYSSSLYQRQIQLNHAVLKGGYRNSTAVTRIINHLSALKTSLLGLGDKDESPALPIDEDATPGKFLQLMQHQLPILKALCGSPDFAVVLPLDESSISKEALDQLKQQISNVLPTPLILTKREIQGLQYKKICVFQPFHHSAAATVCKLAEDAHLAPESIQGKTTRSADKIKTTEQINASAWFNSLYVAGTRAQEELYWYHGEFTKNMPHQLSFLISYTQAPSKFEVLGDLISPKITKTMPQGNEQVEVEGGKQPAPHSTVEDSLWRDEANRQILNGNDSVAKKILFEKLGWTMNDVQCNYDSFAEKIRNPAVTLTKSQDGLKPPSNAAVSSNKTPTALSHNSAQHFNFRTTSSYPPITRPRKTTPEKEESLAPPNNSPSESIRKYMNNFCEQITKWNDTALKHNVNALMTHKSVYRILFTYPIEKHRSLFLKLCKTQVLDIFHQGLSPEMLSKYHNLVNQALSELDFKKDDELQMHLECETGKPLSSISLFEFLMCEESRLFFDTHKVTFRPLFTSETLTPLLTLNDTKKSVLYVLMNIQLGREFIQDNWYMHAHLLDQELWCHADSTPDNDEGQSPLSLLMAHDLDFFISKWNYFKDKITLEAMTRPIDAYPYMGTSLLCKLCIEPEGINCIIQHVEQLFKLGVFTPEIITQAVAEGEYKGISPLYLLFTEPKGLKFLYQHAERFFKIGIFTREAMTRPVAEHPNKGTSPVFILCNSYGGLSFLNQYADQFFEIGIFTVEAMTRPIAEGPYKGVSPLDLLRGNPEGIRFLTQHAERLFALKILTADDMTRLAAKGPLKAMSKSDVLSKTQKSQAVLSQHQDRLIKTGITSAGKTSNHTQRLNMWKSPQESTDDSQTSQEIPRDSFGKCAF